MYISYQQVLSACRACDAESRIQAHVISSHTYKPVPIRQICIHQEVLRALGACDESASYAQDKTATDTGTSLQLSTNLPKRGEKVRYFVLNNSAGIFITFIFFTLID
jgi:hypothetical protein